MPYYFQADGTKVPLPSEFADMVAADPPFGIDFDGRSSVYNRKKDNVLGTYLEIEIEEIEPAVGEMVRILKPTGSLWLVMGWNSLRFWENAAAKFGLYQLGHVIWKYQFGVYTKKRPVTSHYHLLVFTKHRTRWTWNQQGYDEDVWVIKRPYQVGGLKYPNKLPDEVARQMIIRSSKPGDVVVDTFTGSGTIVKVAEECGRVGVGGDLANNKLFWG
jgi:site-specific DNA-methyltransferase (adenine-specific)